MSKQDKCDSTKFYNPIWIFLEQDLTQFCRFTKNIIVRFEFKMSLTAHFLQSEWLSLMKAPFMSKVYPPRSVVLLCRQNHWQKVLLETFYQQKFHYYCLCCRYFDHWLLKNSKYNWYLSQNHSSNLRKTSSVQVSITQIISSCLIPLSKQDEKMIDTVKFKM